jgi:predicted GNAT family N-acyltransferase
MTITTLHEASHHYSSALKLIEESFKYEEGHHFDIDFAPLIDKSNWHNCFIKIQNEQVVAHIGVLEKKIMGSPIAMIGGIAVDKSHRGQGHFQEIFQQVLSEKRSDVACFILWSDNEKLYKKFGFSLCGAQFEGPQTSLPELSKFHKTTLNALSTKELNEIKNLYHQSFAKNYLTLERSDEDWNILIKITSADLFIRTDNNRIESYFFMNKGQDLNGVIYEYGQIDNFSEFVRELQSYGRVWAPYSLFTEAEAQYQFMLSPANTRMFSNLVQIFTRDTIRIRDINIIKQEVYFEFNHELIALEIEDFLRGIWGPGCFEELGQDLRPLFISGLSSI